MIKRIIPSSGEALPLIGLGTWQTFDTDSSCYPDLKTVLETMYAEGGRLIDSSPMYGRSEKVIGDISIGMENAGDFFYATKVWTTGLQEGIDQLESSMQKMRRDTMDLVQVHNLVDWKTHLPQLRRWKESGKIRYIGLTHYTDAYHDELIKLMRSEKPDFVQFNYSIFSRNAETKLLPAAADLGIATLINRPFGEGKFFSKVKGRSLPAWAVELGIESWAAFFLKYIIADPAVTCVIPATADPSHAVDNFKAGAGNLPDSHTRKQMVEFISGL